MSDTERNDVENIRMDFMNVSAILERQWNLDYTSEKKKMCTKHKR